MELEKRRKACQQGQKNLTGTSKSVRYLRQRQQQETSEKRKPLAGIGRPTKSTETKRGRVRGNLFHYHASWLFLRNLKKILVEGKGEKG